MGCLSNRKKVGAAEDINNSRVSTHFIIARAFEWQNSCRTDWRGFSSDFGLIPLEWTFI